MRILFLRICKYVLLSARFAEDKLMVFAKHVDLALVDGADVNTRDIFWRGYHIEVSKGGLDCIRICSEGHNSLFILRL